MKKELTVILYACWYQFKLYDNIKLTIFVYSCYLVFLHKITVQAKMKSKNDAQKTQLLDFKASKKLN